MKKSVYDFTVKGIDGKDVALSKYSGQVLLIVNVASQCGFTSQYKGLEALYKKYQSKGFSVLGFPCNQFGEQEPGSEQEIQQFCELNYQVTFPLFSKIDVNGANAHPLFQFLKESQPGILGTEGIKWNFTKFLIGKNGECIKRFSPKTNPNDLMKDIEVEL